MLAADPLPVLMVLADTQHFYYQEYGDTRAGLEAQGVQAVVTARTTNTTYPHAGTGEPNNLGVKPDIALADVNAADYSAIVFVGGWGASMYQYAFTGNYIDDLYDGDPATKQVVNELVNDFADQDKFLTAICHGVMTLAWARVDGVSPLNGKHVSVPWIGSPAVNLNGTFYGYYQLLQYPQAVANGAIPNTVSGQYGLPGTVADDVVVDGKIITAENYDAAYNFGIRVGQEVTAAAQTTTPPANQAPTLAPGAFALAENSALGTQVGLASGADADVGQTLSYAIVGGNTGGAFAINPLTGQISVANVAALDYETTPTFNLQVEVRDNGAPALSASAQFTINLLDVYEALPPGIARSGNNLVVQGTAGSDTIYVWTNQAGQFFAWMNGQISGPHTLPAGGRAIVNAGDGVDQIYGTDAHLPITINGDGGNDRITGGYAGDVLNGGEGYDRIWGMQGDDVIFGGAGNDTIDGREGNDLIVGGAGDDQLAGFDGRDVLIGGEGQDRLEGGAGEDLLIAGRTSYDANQAALLAILAEWSTPASVATRAGHLAAGLPGGQSLRWGVTVFDDGALDCLNGGDGADWLFLLAADCQYYVTASDLVAS